MIKRINILINILFKIYNLVKAKINKIKHLFGILNHLNNFQLKWLQALIFMISIQTQMMKLSISYIFSIHLDIIKYQ